MVVVVLPGGVEVPVKFDPRQPRDEEGRWSETGGGGSAVVFENDATTAEIRERVRAMDDEQELWVFHATDRQTADTFLAEGINPATKPTSLARERFEAGEEAIFQPGAGLSSGLTVAAKVGQTGGYGRVQLGIKIRKKHLSVPPEQAGTDAADALAVGDAQVLHSIAAADVREVTEPGKDPNVISNVAERLGVEGDGKAGRLAEVEGEIEKLRETLGAEEGFVSGRVTAPKQRRLARLVEERNKLRRELGKRFDPNQRRDEHGRWTETGGGSSGGDVASATEALRALLPEGTEISRLDVPSQGYQTNRLVLHRPGYEDPNEIQGGVVRYRPGEGQHIGHLTWRSDTGEITDVEVEPEYKRRGIATAMLRLARAQAEAEGTARPKHSENQEPEGAAWAQADRLAEAATLDPAAVVRAAEQTVSLAEREIQRARSSRDAAAARRFLQETREKLAKIQEHLARGGSFPLIEEGEEFIRPDGSRVRVTNARARESYVRFKPVKADGTLYARGESIANVLTTLDWEKATGKRFDPNQRPDAREPIEEDKGMDTITIVMPGGIEVLVTEEQLKDFNPQQRRDRFGRWTDSGGSGPTPDIETILEGSVESIRKQVADERPDLGGPPKPPKKGKVAKKVLGNYPDTQAMHSQMDEGERIYSTERKKRHRKIIAHFLRDAEGKEIKPASNGIKQALMSFGGPASGKSTASDAVLIESGDGAMVRIDPDAIKGMLPEYEEMSKAHDPYAAWGAHEESSDISKMLLKEAQARGLNVFVDGTGDSNVGKFHGKMEALKADRYRIKARGMHLPPSEAEKRAYKRAAGTRKKPGNGRFVPPSVLYPTYKSVSLNHAEWRSDPDIDWEVYSNDVPRGQDPILLASSPAGSAEHEVHDESGYEAFLDVGYMDLPKF